MMCRLEQAQTAQRIVADDKENLEKQLEDIGHAKVSSIQRLDNVVMRHLSVCLSVCHMMILCQNSDIYH